MADGDSFSGCVGSASSGTATGAAEVRAEQNVGDVGIGGWAAQWLAVVEQAGGICTRCGRTGADTAFRTWESAELPRRAHPLRGGSRPVKVGPVGPVDRRTEYEHLVPLHAKRAALPEGHVDREQLRAELIAGYLPVARNIARKFGYRGESPDDLEQVASVGLVLAVDRFEPGRGFDFLSFAVPTITGEVLRHSGTGPTRSGSRAGCVRFRR